MRKAFRTGIPVALGLLVAAGAAATWYFNLPKLLRIADSYSAKIVCSGHFVAGRDVSDLTAIDMQAPQNPLLRLISVRVDEQAKTVSAAMLGMLAPAKSVYREGLGCTNLPAGYDLSALSGLPAAPAALPPSGAGAWPEGNDPLAENATPAKLASVLSDPALQGPGMRAILVVRDGQLIGETYAPGFDRNTRQLGWSMTKTVNAAIAARRMQEGKLAFQTKGLLPEWGGDSRKEISLSDLMSMQSGLRFQEDYGDVSDVSRMLYLEPDMAGFSGGQPLAQHPGSHFNYSSGEAVLISRIWMNTFEDPAEATAYPQKALFQPLGMSSAVLEADAAGTFVGSSYMYATPRDWVRFAELLRTGGMWNGMQLLPADFVDALHRPAANSGGEYASAQDWLVAPHAPGSLHALPEDAIWMVGHDGQSIAIIPSEKLVVLRMGITPSGWGYSPEALVRETIKALK